MKIRFMLLRPAPCRYNKHPNSTFLIAYVVSASEALGRQAQE